MKNVNIWNMCGISMVYGTCMNIYGKLVGGLEHEWIIFHFLYGIIPTPLTKSSFSRSLNPPTR
jgi:hypothetical protein